MNKNQKDIISLLSSAIRNEIPIGFANYKVDWEYIYKTAKAHKVETVIYPTVNRLIASSMLSNILNDSWRKAVLQEAIYQINQTEVFASVIEAFNKAKIPIIPYKGVILRELYPYPEFRTMIDIDILVQPVDMPKSENVIKKIGYEEKTRDDRVITYTHPYQVKLELHKYMLRPSKYYQFLDFEKMIWDHVYISNFQGKEIYVLNHTYELVFIILHFFIHYSERGVGLRQLCDIVLYVEAYEDQVKWDEFWDVICKMGAENFTGFVFKICGVYFNMRIQENHLYYKKEMPDDFLEIFIQDILEGGVFGMENSENTIEKFLMKDVIRKGEQISKFGFVQNIQLLLKLLFPQANDMGSRYNYIKKGPGLLPFAWIHRILHVLFQEFDSFIAHLKRFFILVFDRDKVRYYRSIGLKEIGSVNIEKSDKN